MIHWFPCNGLAYFEDRNRISACQLCAIEGRSKAKFQTIRRDLNRLLQGVPLPYNLRALFNLVPVPAQIAGSLLLSGKFGLETARVSAISVRNLENYSPLEFRCWSATAAH